MTDLSSEECLKIARQAHKEIKSVIDKWESLEDPRIQCNWDQYICVGGFGFSFGYDDLMDGQKK